MKANSILSGKISMRCPLCGSEQNKILFPCCSASEGKKQNYLLKANRKPSNVSVKLLFDVLRCSACGLGFADLDPKLQNDLIDSQESEPDFDYEQQREIRKAGFKHLIKRIQKNDSDFLNRKRALKVLDIGCYTGIFLEAAQEQGWLAQGIEPNAWAAGLAEQKYGLKVEPKTVEAAEFSENTFDLITFWDVLEHLKDPLSVLKKVNNWLVKDGSLVVLTPNLDSLAARLLKHHWWCIRQSHWWYFSHKTMEKLFDLAGFKMLTRYSVGRKFSLAYWCRKSSEYSNLLANLTKLIPAGSYREKIVIPVNIYDQFAYLAVKK